MKALPPLLAIIDGKRPRPRRALVSRPRETALHLAVAELLRRHCLSSWRWSHFPAGEARDVRTGAKLKRMGLQRGWPDFLLIRPARGTRGTLHCLELKRIGEDLSEDQQAFADWCAANAIPFEVARTSGEALAILTGWRCLRISGGAV